VTQPVASRIDRRDDVIELLVADHAAIRAGFDAVLHEWESFSRRDRFESLARLLAQHEIAEEEAVYPVLGQLGPEGREVRDALLAAERRGKVLLTDAIRRSFWRPGSRRFKATLVKLRDAVEAHAAHEEQVALPLLRRSVNDAKLQMMASWFRQAKALAPTRPHPHGPERLFALLAIGPILALVDHGRDRARRLVER
jgi:hypothetical protein